ncbi:ParB/RepB/Spo0J family partition protein [Legionella septentrionalis]|uniref:ParB/RepB/Spo0J family partition protein n=1 Tax=Legionella septentrionalis TaxID=2498109 RepID=UPI001315AD24|nr:ParB/RepB/Spo0J family partition protein [Legionella septentrionalis]
MSTRKKRSLSNVIVSNENPRPLEEKKVILPAASRTVQTDSNKSLEIVRGNEFLVDTSDCKPWRFHNRDTIWMSLDKCQDLISSIRKNGQKVPIFARKIENDPEGKNWEIIAGRRRWFACNHLGKKVRVKAVEASDRECAILMSLENKDRNDISEFEDAISYKQQLEAKLFDSQDEMAAALDLKKSKLSKMLSAAKISNYSEVMSLFDDITLLKINPIYSLVLLIEKSDRNRAAIVQKAIELREVNSKRKNKLKVNVIISELVDSIKSEKESTSKKSKTYKIGEKTIFKANLTSNRKVVFEINRSNITSEEQEKVREMLIDALDEFV